jgi:tetratricopeptide (TPR) repeat protein
MKRFSAKLPVVTAMMAMLILAGSLLAQSGRPKVLVLRPSATIEDAKVIEKFQWELASALDKSGKFDIVKKGDYENAMKAFNLDKDGMVPDSLVPAIMDSLQALIYASGNLEQPGGKKTQLSAKIDYVSPTYDFTIEGNEVTVTSEDQVEDLARKATESLIIKSEAISLKGIARSYYNSAIYDKAIENYEKLLVLAPEDINVHYMVGLSYLKAENKEAAFAKFQQILADINPDHKPTLEILATTNFADENFEEALKYYQKLAEVDPQNYDYTRYWAFSLEKLERKSEAMDVYRKLVQIRDEDPAIRGMMGYYYYVLADSLDKAKATDEAKNLAVQACDNLKRAVDLENNSEGNKTDPQWINAHCQKLFLLGRSEMLCGKNAEALATLTDLTGLMPEYQYAFYYMAQIAYDQKNWNKSIEFFNKAAEQGPASISYVAYRRTASIYDKELKQYNNAANALTNALKVVPAADKPTVIFLRGMAYHDYGNQLDYTSEQDIDMDELIQAGKMTTERADQALGLYDKAAADFALVTSGKLAKSASEHLDRIAQLRDRVNKIKQQISYYEKTK